MGKIIAIVNHKGGVGKTTTAVNLAAALALQKNVLLVDIDHQGNATSGVGLIKNRIQTSSYDVLCGRVSAQKAIIKTPFDKLWVIPAVKDLAGAEVELVNVAGRESMLKTALAPLKNSFDYIFLDCPPSLGLITINALCAADTFLVPMQSEFYALEGLSQLLPTVRQVKRYYNDRLSVEGVLLTMYDGRLRLTQQVVAEISKVFPNDIYNTVIPRAVRLSEAPSFGKPIIYYDKNSKGGRAYLDLAKEFMQKNAVRRQYS